MLAVISDQCQLGYIALQNIVDAMKELIENDSSTIQDNSFTRTTNESVGLLHSQNTKSLVSSLKKQKQQTAKKIQKNLTKKGIYQVFDLLSETHLSSRLWLKARILFVQFMFNQLNDAGKAKGNDDNIIRDFGDLKYYCDKGLKEAEQYFDIEAKGFFKFIEGSVDLIRGTDLEHCLKKLNESLLDFVGVNQLSFDGVLNYFKVSILKNDLSYSVDLLDSSDQTNNKNKNEFNFLNVLNNSIQNFTIIQKYILENLKRNGGETIEYYVSKDMCYFDNIASSIKNLYNPLYHYLIHVKLRLGSTLMLKSSYVNNKINEKYLSQNEIAKDLTIWIHSLNVLSSALELNKVICERSLCLEIELSYKYAHCIREIFMMNQLVTLSDVVDAYGYTLMLVFHSNHDLNIIKNCYLELAIAFISTYDSKILLDSRSGFHGLSEKMKSSIDSVHTTSNAVNIINNSSEASQSVRIYY